MNTPPANLHLEDHQRTLLIKAASYASLGVALALVVLKVWGWQETDSVSLLSSLADSVLDVFASAITFFAVRISLSPADSEHRFGHGKSEGLAALLQSLIIAGSGLYVCFEAISRVWEPRDISAPEIGLSVVIVATAATILLVLFQHYVGRKTGSVAISADAAHYKTDVMINLGVGIAIIAAGYTGVQIIDPLVGMLIALFVVSSAWKIGNRALRILLDHEIPLKDRQKIETLALDHPEVRGLHDMKTRFGGNHYIVQFHLELDPQISLLRSHAILDEVEWLIMDRYPGCEILIHADPQGIDEPRDPFD